MARKFNSTATHVCWGTNLCEEMFIIASFENIKRYIRPGSAWKSEYEDRFYTKGQAISQTTINFINLELKRQSMKEINLVETDIGEYARENDTSKRAKFRCDMADKYEAMTLRDRNEWYNQAIEAMKAQTPPHYTQAEHAFAYPEKTTLPVITPPTSIATQIAAQVKPQATAKPTPQDMAGSKVLKLLKLAKKADTIALLVERLTPDEAMTACESGDFDDEIMNTLILKAVG